MFQKLRKCFKRYENVSARFLSILKQPTTYSALMVIVEQLVIVYNILTHFMTINRLPPSTETMTIILSKLLL